VKAPIDWRWPAVAGLAVVVALLAGPVRWLAASAATVAVVAATLAMVTELGRRRSGAGRPKPSAWMEPDQVRDAFHAGGAGRVELVLACDLLERKLSRPDLRAETPVELDTVARMGPEEFRRYLDRRLRALEAAS
jgi:hypothetical protein